MRRNTKLHRAVLCALAAGTYAGSLFAQDVPETPDAAQDDQQGQGNDEREGVSVGSLPQAQEAAKQLEDVIVTATKRARNPQKTPIAVDAMSTKRLSEMGIGDFGDLVKYQPKLAFGGRGPGQNTVFIRGMAIQPITVLLSAAQGTSPNVAIYLDEQPVSAPGRNLDVYTTDLARVEVLPGPQGTLFGASSQAGTIRYITNKPDHFGFDAGVTTKFSGTDNGEPSQSIEGFINVPLTDDIATRVAFYNVQNGGYIDNVEGTFTLDPDKNPKSSVDLGPDAIYDVTSNASLAEDDFNDSSYKGVRASMKWDLSPDWDLLVQNSWQELQADGVFDYNPEVGDLEVQRFFPDELEDTFNQTTWTLEGRYKMLDLVYTGGYLDREINQSVDYTGYNNAGAFIAYYTCTYDNPAYITNYGADPDAITDVRHCLDPTKGAIIDQTHERITNEFRLSTPDDNQWRFIGGIFHDSLEIETIDDYHYFANMPVGALGFAPNAPISGANSIDPTTRPPTVAFFNDITRSEDQIALFGEFSYDFVPDWTGTIGFRWYDIESDFTGSSNFANGIFQGSTDSDRGRDYDVSGGHSPAPLEQDDVIPKLSLSWQMTNDILFYGTYSEGFRPGGFNRGGGLASRNPSFPTVDTTYDTDDVKNLEFGWKSQLLDNSLRWNGNIYSIDWSDMQVSRFDPVNVSILTFIENSADSEIFGIESDLTWRATDNLTLYGAMSYNDTELTAVDAQVIEMAPIGSELPLVPELQTSLRARYEWGSPDSEWYDYAHWQIAMKNATDSWSSIVAAEREKQDGYTVADASFGISKGPWNAELFINNIFNERAELFINTQDDIRRITTIRPTTFGMKLSYRFQP